MVVTLLRQIEVEIANGKTTPQACREAQITAQTFYRWRNEFRGLKVDQAKRLKELEKEHAKLKRLVADLSLEKQGGGGRGELYDSVLRPSGIPTKVLRVGQPGQPLISGRLPSLDPARFLTFWPVVSSQFIAQTFASISSSTYRTLGAALGRVPLPPFKRAKCRGEKTEG